MGENDYLELKEFYEVVSEDVVNENFKFGPFRIYKSRKKVKIILRFGEDFMELGFFVVE